jgi:hypothetical protein
MSQTTKISGATIEKIIRSDESFISAHILSNLSSKAAEL